MVKEIKKKRLSGHKGKTNPTPRGHRAVQKETISGLPNVDLLAGDLLKTFFYLLRFPIDIGDDYFTEANNFIDESAFYSIIREADPKKVNKAIELRRNGLSKKETMDELGISLDDFTEESNYAKSINVRKFIERYLDKPLGFLEDNLKLIGDECECSSQACYGPFLCPLVIIKHISKNGYKTARKIRRALLEGPSVK